jgi:hypothetical protein
MKETEKDFMKAIAEFVTKHPSSAVEILAALVIAVALIKFLIKYVRNMVRQHFEQENQNNRIQFGSSLTIAVGTVAGGRYSRYRHCTNLGRDWQTGSHCHLAYGTKLFSRES